MFDQIQGEAPLALATEAAHPPRRIGRKADARLLAVVADVDARLELLPDHVTHGGFGLAGEGGGVDGFPAVLAHEEIAKRRRSRKTAGVRGQDAIVAALRIASSGRRDRALPRRPG